MSRCVRYVQLVVFTLAACLTCVLIGLLTGRFLAARVVNPNLEYMVRYTGAIVALVASFLAAPEATRHLWKWIRGTAATTTGRVIRAGKARVEQVWNRVRRRGRWVDVAGSGSAAATISASLTVTGRLVFPVDLSAPLSARVERLEQHVQALGELHEANKQAIAQEKASLVEKLRNVEHQIDQETAAIRSKIDSMEQTAMVVDARALPVIGFGIVLSSMSDLIALSPVLSYVAVAVAAGFVAIAVAHFNASLPVGAGDRSDA